VDDAHRRSVNAGYIVSVQSVAWTVIASTVAIVVGVQSRTTVLLAFGAVGFVDAAGSAALAYHFHHGLRHDQLSAQLERVAHRVVLWGLGLVGCGAIVGGVVRLLTRAESKPSGVGIGLAAVSLAVLVLLAARKRVIARDVGSAALLSDAHLSTIGATQAAVTLAGTVITRWLGWTWADAVATAGVGIVAVMLAVLTSRAAA
jgi:divalent metal cation (Fe/Co/Zn/Cd) transporter